MIESDGFAKEFPVVAQCLDFARSCDDKGEHEYIARMHVATHYRLANELEKLEEEHRRNGWSRLAFATGEIVHDRSVPEGEVRFERKGEG